MGRMTHAGDGKTLVPVPRGVRAVAVFGGSFDPPHAGHVGPPAQAVERVLGPGGWLLYVPAGRSPLKAASAASDADRLAMLRLALRGRRRCSIWTDELDRSGGAGAPSYTVDTLVRLRRALDGRAGRGGGSPALRLLIGADQAAQFHRWRRYRRVLALAQPMVMLREPVATPAALWRALEQAGVWTRAQRLAWCGWITPTDVLEAASTAIRAGAEGKAGAAGTLTPAVRRYIERRGLYGG